MTDLRLKKFESYEYKDPYAFLKSLWKIEPAINFSGLDYKVRSLHTRKLRDSHERRQAALFAQGMAARLPDFCFNFACVEDEDYDAVVRWHNQTEINYTPVQLKEFVPEHLNQKASLEKILGDLRKYTSSSDLVVTIFLNRKFTLDLSSLSFERLKLAGLYFVGAANQDKSNWHLIGDMLGSPTLSSFITPDELQ